MWCTRWYLPLILLPLPIAPPFFLALFLLSLTLHARPCFYCIVLLTALFLSSCYWPPVPIDTPLTTPWSENITTYAGALLSLMPDVPTEIIPTDIHIADHCWCDLTSGKFFEPFDLAKWELESVVKLRDELQFQRQLLAQTEEDTMEKDEARSEGEEPQAHVNSTSNANAPSAPNAPMYASKWPSIIGSMWSLLHPPSRLPSASVSQPTSHEATSTLVASSTSVTTPTDTGLTSSSVVLGVASTSLPLFRREYDLRPYGFDMVIDFGWSRKRS